MKAGRVTEITSQTEESVIVRRSVGSVHVLCAVCGSAVPMVTTEAAAALFGVGARVIYREIEAGRLDFQETPAGSVVVCLDSLQKIAPLLSGDRSSQIKINQ